MDGVNKRQGAIASSARSNLAVTLDYDRYVSLLHKYRFPGPLLLHGLTEAQMPGCVAFLREKIARLNPKPAGK